jgi:hypothetical protein
LPRELLWAVIIALVIVLLSVLRSSHRISEFAGIKLGEALLVVVTWMLWAATRQLVKGADRTAERQLLAYVYIEDTRFKSTETGQ